MQVHFPLLFILPSPTFHHQFKVLSLLSIIILSPNLHYHFKVLSLLSSLPFPTSLTSIQGRWSTAITSDGRRCGSRLDRITPTTNFISIPHSSSRKEQLGTMEGGKLTVTRSKDSPALSDHRVHSRDCGLNKRPFRRWCRALCCRNNPESLVCFGRIRG